MQTNIYVDGFNLYYGALKRTAYKWLDIRAMCALVLNPKHSIQRIRYFTALVKPNPKNPDVHNRQQTYIRALQAATPNLSVHYGSFLSHPAHRMLADASGFVQVVETTEKGSDVNLASYLLLDAFNKDFESAVIVSNDSDLAEPIRMVRYELGIDNVGVLNPHAGNPRGTPAVVLKKVAKFQLPVTRTHVATSQMTSPVSDPTTGHAIHKPKQW